MYVNICIDVGGIYYRTQIDQGDTDYTLYKLFLISSNNLGDLNRSDVSHVFAKIYLSSLCIWRKKINVPITEQFMFNRLYVITLITIKKKIHRMGINVYQSIFIYTNNRKTQKYNN